MNSTILRMRMETFFMNISDDEINILNIKIHNDKKLNKYIHILPIHTTSNLCICLLNKIISVKNE